MSQGKFLNPYCPNRINDKSGCSIEIKSSLPLHFELLYFLHEFGTWKCMFKTKSKATIYTHLSLMSHPLT
jgi:hypothetical protein